MKTFFQKIIAWIIWFLFGRKGQAAYDAYQAEGRKEVQEAQQEQDKLVQEAEDEIEKVETKSDSELLDTAKSTGLVSDEPPDSSTRGG